VVDMGLITNLAAGPTTQDGRRMTCSPNSVQIRLSKTPTFASNHPIFFSAPLLRHAPTRGWNSWAPPEVQGRLHNYDLLIPLNVPPHVPPAGRGGQRPARRVPAGGWKPAAELRAP